MDLPIVSANTPSTAPTSFDFVGYRRSRFWYEGGMMEIFLYYYPHPPQRNNNSKNIMRLTRDPSEGIVNVRFIAPVMVLHGFFCVPYGQLLDVVEHDL